MPATEKTWRNQKLLNHVFAATGVLLLISTIWMLIKDHDRQWRGYQQTTRSVELTYNEWKQEQAKAEVEKLQAELQAQLLEAQSQPMPEDLLEQFKQEVQGDAQYRQLQPYDFTRIESLFKQYNDLATEATQKRAKADNLRQRAETAEKEATAAKVAAQQAEQKVDAAKDTEAAAAAAENARQFAEKADDTHKNLDEQANQADEEATTAEHAAAARRTVLLDALRSIMRAARFREEKLLGERKFTSANLDAAKAKFDIAVRDEAPEPEKAALQEKVDKLKSEVDGLTKEYEHAAAHREALREQIEAITAEEAAADKQLADARAELEQLQKAEKDRRATWFVSSPPWLGKKWLEMPILDAFQSPLKIDNKWHEGNTIDYNFARVRRFDRCTTCHQSIDKTQAGSATAPAYVGEESFQLVLRTPTTEQLQKLTGGEASATLESAYGFRLADRGLVEFDAVTVSFVRPASGQTEASTLAARARIYRPENVKLTGEQIRRRLLESAGDAKQEPPERPGLMAGDIITHVNGSVVYSAEDVQKYLLDSVTWGEPVRVTVRRGLPEPYVTHPRMDLFVGSLSPHNLATFACTICHEGQGSATDFKWASHTPNTPQEGRQWAREYGWFDNHHWIFPMYPERFAESSCLKCHHQVIELEGQLITANGDYPADRFLQEPAPKLMHGYDLVRKYGCFGCHEINGYGKGRTVGPDLRLEPNVSEAAQQIMSDPGFEKLTQEQQSWAEQLKFHPERSAIRHRLLEAVQADQQLAKQDEAKLSPVSHKVGALLADVESPGEMRKVGPSLRRVKHKLTPVFMYDWVRKPSHFRPDTRMPQFFGQWDHLTIHQRLHELEEHTNGHAAAGDEADDDEGESDGEHQDMAMRFEPIEILGVVTYLQSKSQAYEYAQPVEGTAERTKQERIANGKLLFENRGCLACHKHKDFPDADQYRPAKLIVQGPDLSAISEKFSAEKNPNGPKWLYSWIHNPSSYNPRTLMPNLLLVPYDEPVMDTTKTPAEPKVDADGKPVTRRIDPVADIVEYLLADSHSDWEPILADSIQAEDDNLVLDEEGQKTLDELVQLNLKDAFSTHLAEQYTKDGIPEDMRSTLTGAEVELVGGSINEQKKLMYIGSKVIARYGCYGCHDVPGFEDAKPIGTGLADWGRKDTSKLAFEHITEYLKEKHRLTKLEENNGGAEDGGMHGAGNGADAHPSDAEGSDAGGFTAQDYLFYENALQSGHRSGFIWQKLLEPRSFDYEKTENKKYSERLRMPHFPFTDTEREAVITFVLGLVADPPDPMYVYEAAPRQEAILAGRRVAEKYNCVGCHMFELEKWDISYAPDAFGEQLSVQTFPFMNAHFLPEQIEESKKLDRRGMRHAMIVGLPTIADADALPVVNDFEGDPLSDDDEYDPATVEYLFDLWRPLALDGHTYQTAVLPLRITDDMIQRKTPARGGILAKYLASRVIAQARATGKQVKGTEAWGWVPPPLVGEGEKVQTDWLHDFLLDPHMIRPEVVLRMPKFNMSPDEASKLVNYFAAKDEVPYPYNFSPRRREDYLKEQQQGYAALLEKLSLPKSTRFEDARKIVFNKAGCIQCHAVADYYESPRGPNLVEVYKRLRGDWVRRWIANPKRILPYTAMPENFKYNPENPQEAGFVATHEEGGETKKEHLVHGTATEQLDAMVDLLMNFDLDAQHRSPYAPLAQQAETPAEGETGAGGETGGDSGASGADSGGGQ